MTLRAYHRAITEMDDKKAAVLPIPITQLTYLRAEKQKAEAQKKRRR